MTRSLDLERSAIVAGKDRGASLAMQLAALGLRLFQLGALGAETWGAITHALLDRPRTASVRRRTARPISA